MGELDTSGDTTVMGASSNTISFFAPPEYTESTPGFEYLCAQDGLQPANFACATLVFPPLELNLSPDQTVSIPQGKTQLFQATLSTEGGALPPANQLKFSDENPAWESWTNTGPPSASSSTCTTGSTASQTTSTATNDYTYCAPNQPGSGDFSIKAIVAVPEGSANLSASANVAYTVASNLASQTISFPTIPPQTIGSSFTLAATSSSGLPVTYTTTTPAVVSISGTTVTTTSVGTASITAQQAGSSSYSVATATQSFVVTGTAAPPTFSPAPGTFNSVPTVTISDASPGTSIYYAVGSTPTTSSTKYTGPTAVTNSITVQAIASGGFYTAGPVATATYSLAALPPVFSPPAGTYPGPLTVTITTASPGVDIFYTTAGNLAGTSAPRYTAPITVASTETLNAVTAQTGWTSSADVAAAYTIEPYAAPPAFSVASGTYATAQTVTITDTTAGATIYYTTNGTTPNTTSSVCSGPMTVSSSETLNAIAVANNYSNSAVAAAVYTIQ
jgi:hypothetical protein